MPTQKLSRITLTKKHQALLTSFVAMSEYDFTMRVVIPFLASVGYSKIDYHGGPGEDGKDLICWSTDRLGNRELSVAQVKKFRLNRADSTPHNFSEVVNQLSKCVEKSIPHADGHKYLPSTVYFVSPHALDTRTLLDRFEAFAVLRGGRLKIIDGALLAENVEKFSPALVSELCGPEIPLQEAVASTLNNETLMRVLQVKEMRALPDIYTDLDFFLGRPSGRTFLRSRFAPISVSTRLDQVAWDQFLRRADLIECVLHINVITEPREAVQRNYDEQTRASRDWEHLHRDSRLSVEASEKRVLNARQEILEVVPSSRKKRVNRSLTDFENKIFREIRAPKVIVPSISDLSARIHALPLFAQSLGRHKEIVKNYLSSLHASIRTQMTGLQIEKDRPAPPRFVCTIDGERLAAALKERREWLKAQVALFNNHLPTASQLRTFLLETAKLFSTVHEAITDESICKSLQLQQNDFPNEEGIDYLMSISLHRIFDTGLNLSILGEAGAGKTTTLQMYAYRKARSDGDKLALFIPIARAVRSWRSQIVGHVPNATQSSDSSVQAAPRLLEIVHSYARELAPGLERITVEQMFSRGAVIALLDGVDEAIGEAPWLLQSAANAAQEYPKAQFIMSSRMAGQYIRELPFQACTLHAFTSRQRSRFVCDWFRQAREDRSSLILDHLKKSPILSNVVRNPLLVTLLCVLAEHGVPLPASELRLYEERHRLLLGYYDVAKGISRIFNALADLDRLSSRIALWLHRNNERQAPIHVLHEHATIAFEQRLDKNVVKRVVDELIDPCNILVPMSDDGQFGFGHLRFQEYLAARELLNDRSLDICKVMGDVWWHDVLLFYAELTNSLDWLVMNVAESGSGSKAWETLIDMVGRRPATEARQLRKLIGELRGEGDQWRRDFGHYLQATEEWAKKSEEAQGVPLEDLQDED